MPPSGGRLTPTQVRLLTLLADGQAHGIGELHGCLWDDLATNQAVNVQLTYMRRLLRPIGQDIVCVRNRGGAAFRLVLHWLPVRHHLTSLPLHPLLPTPIPPPAFPSEKRGGL